MAKKAEKLIKSHKEGNDLNIKADVKELTGMNSSKTEPRLDAWDDVAETDPEDIGGSMATIEATLNYINKVLNEGDETGPEDDLDSDDLNDAEMDMANDGDEEEEPEFDDNGETGFGDDGEDEGDMDECGEDDEDFEGYDADEEDFGDTDDEDNEELGDDGDAVDDEEDDDEDFEDDFSEGFWLESDDMPDTEVVGTEPDSDLGDEDGSEDATAGISVDIPDDVDPNDVEVSIGGSSYVPDIDSGEDIDDEDVGDEDEDEYDNDDVVIDEDDGEDAPVAEGVGYTGGSYNAKYPGLVEDDDFETDDVTDTDDEKDEDDDDADELTDIDDDEDTDEVTETAVLKVLRKLIREDQRSDDSHTEDPSCNTGDAPIDSECDIDDSTAKETDLSGDEGEVTDADIPIENGTIQPEEAAELKWLANKLKKIIEGDDESHKDEGKTSAEPLDDDAKDMLDDIGDALESDETLTDIGDGAVDDGETTLGETDEEEKITDNDEIGFTSSNGSPVDDDEADDEEKHLTDSYHILMNLIDKTFSEGKKKTAKKDDKKKKKIPLKKVDKKATKKGGKKVKESSDPTIAYPELNPTGTAEKVGNYNLGKTTNDKATGIAKENKPTLENTVLGNFNTSEMTSVLKSLNNAFGTGSTSVSKEIRDSQVVSEVSVPTKALPIAENATWDGINAGKLLIETAYKSESKVNTNLLKLTHLYWINEGTNPDDYKFPIASMVEGKAQIIPEAINEATQLFASPSFILRFSESALKKIRNVLDFYNEKMGKKSPWKSNDQIQVSEAAKITMIDRTSYNPYAVLKRLSEQENAKKLLKIRG